LFQQKNNVIVSLVKIEKMRKLIVLCLLLTTFMACKNSSSNNVNPSNADIVGVWKVSYYFDDKDETSDFNGYTFDFKSDGKFVANFSSRTVTGTWSENNSSNKLIIDISGTKALDDVKDDWLITEKTSTSIKLKDDNLTKNEQIHFVKN
jgi:hypothetical protein